MSATRTKKDGLRPRRAVAKVRERKKASFARRWLKRLMVLVLVLGGLGGATVAGAIWYYGRDLPDVASLREYEPPQTTRILDRNGEALGEVFSERRTVVAMDRIPRHLVLCVLAAEDADFYQHEGLDYPGIVRAVVHDLAEGRAAQGASTITQQVVKLLLLSPERTLARKIKELILARRLEQELTKDEILHLYLNHINFGHARYGVQEASRYYFGKDVDELTLAESSLIAGVPQSPARLSPRSHPEAARRRQGYVLRQLEAKREQYWPDLDSAAIEAAGDTEVELVSRVTSEETGPEMLRIVRRELRELVGEDAYRHGGYTVHTTLDLTLQAAARAALREGLEAVDERHRHRGPLRRPRRRPALEAGSLRPGRALIGEVVGTDDESRTIVFDVGGREVIVDLHSEGRYDPDEMTASAFAPIGARAHLQVDHIPDDDEERATGRLVLGPQGAAIVIDPRSRDVLALVGGYDGGPGFDRATQAVRQPGSTFKPIVYALGIRSQIYTPASMMIDAPAVYDQWQPENYETWRHAGPVRLREALARSINLVAVRAIEEVGPDEVVRFSRQLGITTELEPSLSLALGASGTQPIQMVNAYATFAAGGRWAPPRFITRVVGPDGEDINLPAAEEPRDVLTPAEAFVVTSMMQSVVEDGGTGTRAQRLGRPVAGKTGTSNEARDAWFIGYTPNVVAGVWVGFDDRRTLGRREGGGRTALPIWVDVVNAAVSDEPVVSFSRPSGVVRVNIDPATGLRAYEGMENAIEEDFIEGTEPTEEAPSGDVDDPNSFLMEQLGGATGAAAP